MLSDTAHQIALVPHRFDETPAIRSGGQLAAEAMDENLHRPAVRTVAIAIDMGDQGCLAYRHAAAEREQLQDLILLGAKAYAAAIGFQRPGGKVQGHRPKTDACI